MCPLPRHDQNQAANAGGGAVYVGCMISAVGISFIGSGSGMYGNSELALFFFVELLSEREVFLLDTLISELPFFFLVALVRVVAAFGCF
jgi:hypothetical protein